MLESLVRLSDDRDVWQEVTNSKVSRHAERQGRNGHGEDACDACDTWIGLNRLLHTALKIAS